MLSACSRSSSSVACCVIRLFARVNICIIRKLFGAHSGNSYRILLSEFCALTSFSINL